MIQSCQAVELILSRTMDGSFLKGSRIFGILKVYVIAIPSDLVLRSKCSCAKDLSFSSLTASVASFWHMWVTTG